MLPLRSRPDTAAMAWPYRETAYPYFWGLPTAAEKYDFLPF
jgi:hypothetical protein